MRAVSVASDLERAPWGQIGTAGQVLLRPEWLQRGGTAVPGKVLEGTERTLIQAFQNRVLR